MNLIKYKAFYLIFSVALMIPGLFFILRDGLNLGIDFTGGSTSRYSFTSEIPTKQVLELYVKNGAKEVETSTTGKTLIVRSRPIDTSTNAKISKEIATKYKGSKIESFETVGPAVGAETTKKAFLAVLVSSLAIMLYMAYSFRNIPRPYSSLRFGVSAILAMLHDAFIVVGIFAILGHYLNVEIDALFITALLTILGFSVHDTIVVFDRIRENLSKLPKTYNFEAIANYSMIETLNRSIITSLTVLITLFSLLVLGGDSIRYFVLALLIGILSGTYSSIFTATPILVYWENFSAKRAKNRKISR
jgi:preprotein translocase subunit SecF